METYIERIETYEEGGLSEEDRRRFESELESDPDLKSAYDLYQQGNQLIEWNIAENLRSQLQTWAQEEKGAQSGAKVVNFRQLRWAAAAAIALLLSVWFVFDRMQAPQTDAMLFAAYYQAPDASGLRGQNAQENPVLPGVQLMEEKQAGAARQYFLGLLEQEPENPEYLYYAGHAAMIQQDWSAAEAYFAQAEKTAPVALSQKAAWNRALALLSAGRSAELKAVLNAIAADPDHSYFQQAKALLSRK